MFLFTDAARLLALSCFEQRNSSRTLSSELENKNLCSLQVEQLHSPINNMTNHSCHFPPNMVVGRVKAFLSLSGSRAFVQTSCCKRLSRNCLHSTPSSTFFSSSFFFSALSLYRVYLSAANHFLQSRGQHTPQRGQPPGGEGGQRPQAPLGSKGRLLSLRASFTHVSLLQAAGACLVKWAATLRSSLSPQLLIAAQRV